MGIAAAEIHRRATVKLRGSQIFLMDSMFALIASVPSAFSRDLNVDACGVFNGGDLKKSAAG